MNNRNALLVIDVQIGYFAEERLPHESNELLTRISKLIEKARGVGVLVVYIQNCGRKGRIDEVGAAGWQIHPAVAPAAEDLIIQKQYSDSFFGTPLHEELQARGVGHVILTGLQTEYCVDTTCRRAFSLGYKVTLVEDGHSTWSTPVLTASQIIAHHNDVLSGTFATTEAAQDVVMDSADLPAKDPTLRQGHRRTKLLHSARPILSKHRRK
jgi:nicotinamidase-related amidase